VTNTHTKCGELGGVKLVWWFRRAGNGWNFLGVRPANVENTCTRINRQDSQSQTAGE